MTRRQNATSFLEDQLMGQEGPDWNAVRDTLRRNPKAVVNLQHDEKNALHLACYKNAPLTVVQLVARQLLGAIKKKDAKGNLPLHIACCKTRSLEVIQWLVQQHPNSVRETDSDGELPLHAACAANQSLRVIQWLVQQYPDAIKIKCGDGSLPLHVACLHNQSLEVIQFLVQQHPDAVKEKNSNGNHPLDFACGGQQSLEVIDLLVQKHPNAVKEKDSKGDLPLHQACGDKQVLKVIAWLVQQYPDAVKEKNNRGNLPLHLACRNEQVLDVIVWLVQNHADAVNERNLVGELPLHLACGSKHQSLEVIQLLVQLHPNHISETVTNGMTPLDYAKHPSGDQGPDPKIVEWLEAAASGQVNLSKSPELGEIKPDGPISMPTTVGDKDLAHPSAAAANEDEITINRSGTTSTQHAISFLVNQLKGQEEPDWTAVFNTLRKYPKAVVHVQYDDGSNALHVACRKNAPLSVVQLIGKQYPDAIKQKDAKGKLPLHVACWTKQSLEVIQWLVQQYPDAVKENDNDGDLPVHFACGYKQVLEVIQLLVRQHPDALKEKDIHGTLPLHWACATDQSLEVIQFLVQQHPDTVRINNHEGDLPLHIACGSNHSLEVIQWLVQQHPDSIKETNTHDNLPLHRACAYKQSLKVIQWIVQQHPDAVKEKMSEGDLPLHVACKLDQSLEVIDFLVQQHPDAVKETNRRGNFPLHLACAFYQPLEVVDFLVQKQPDVLKEKNSEGELPMHMACGCEYPSLKVIQLLVQLQPSHFSERTHKGKTPLDYAKHPYGNQGPDLIIVEWLEAVASGQINLAKIPPAQPNLSPVLGEKIPDSPIPLPTYVVDKDLAKLPTAAANNEEITKDRKSVLAVLVGKNEMASVSFSYVESTRTEEIIGDGVFGPVYKGIDVALNRKFAVKLIKTDVLWGGHSADVQDAKEKFLTEIKAFSLIRHPNIESLYAYALPDDARCCGYLVCELAEKGSLDNLWKSDLGHERLSLFRRRIQIALDVVTAIQFLHVGNDQVSSCTNCNIKSANIVLKRDFTAQLVDCGMAKFVCNANKSQSKRATGYLCSQYGSGGMPLEHSCDIFSFGVVLAELLTGKLQNHNCIDRLDQAREIKLELDPAMGYGTLALPNYVEEFADLAISCMQSKPEDRPAGEAVMAKLVAIMNQCCSRNSDAGIGISFAESLPGDLKNKFKDKCKVCRTFPLLSPQSVCAVCKSAEGRRSQMSFRGETRRNIAARNAKFDASLPLLSRVDTRLNVAVPRLFIIVPLAMKSVLKEPPNTWLRSHNRTRYCLYFVCIHSLKAIKPPVPIIVTKCWLKKVAPVLAMSLYLLHAGLKPGDGIDLDYGGTPVRLKLDSAKLADILESVSEILTETSSSCDMLDRLRRSEELDEQDIRQLNGDAYELVVEMAGEDRGWRDRMEPVRKNGSSQIFWVSKDVACETSNGYDIVQV